MIESGIAGATLLPEEPLPMWGSVVVLAVAMVVTLAVVIPPVTVIDMSAIFVAPANIIAILSTIVVLPVLSKSFGIAVLPFNSKLEGNANVNEAT